MTKNKVKLDRILFLDFDGVLHPNEVQWDTSSGVVLKAGGHNLFEHVKILMTLLSPHPQVQIVLSTAWLLTSTIDNVNALLPHSLQKRIMGATYHGDMDWHSFINMTRYEQIASYVELHRIKQWVAVDDDDIGWPNEKRGWLVHTNQWNGLGESKPQEELASIFNTWKKDR